MKNRSPNQYRERFINSLDVGIKKTKWTKEEDDKLKQLHDEHGNKWVFIAKQMEGRSANDVKNRYNYHFKKNKSVTIPSSDKERSSAFVPTSIEYSVEWNVGYTNQAI